MTGIAFKQRGLFSSFTAPQTVPELIVTPLSPISLHIEWSGINVNMLNGAIIQYHVMWRRFRAESNYIQALPKEARQYTITGKMRNDNIIIRSKHVTHLTNIGIQYVHNIITIIMHVLIRVISGLKSGGQYEVQVLGATQNGLPRIDFSWQFVELPPVNPILPTPELLFRTVVEDQSIWVRASLNLLLYFGFCFFYETIVF